MASVNLTQLKAKYIQYVIQNPVKIGQLESSLRVLSYLLPANLDASGVWSELLYSASNLLVLANDALLLKTLPDTKNQTAVSSTLLRILSVLDCVEVLCELGSQHFGGSQLRWIVILVVQLTKLSVRLYILLWHQVGLLSTPPIANVDRSKIAKLRADPKMDREKSKKSEVLLESNVSTTFHLKDSRRVMRKLNGAPPVIQRTWKLPKSGENSKSTMAGSLDHTEMRSFMIAAESLHISRPVTHLLALYLCGGHSWKPWLLSCAFDVSSVLLFGHSKQYTESEQVELKRRVLMLLLYLLRSPFYDKCSRTKIIMLLHALSLPGLSFITKPVIDYLPLWQKIYFYIWST